MKSKVTKTEAGMSVSGSIDFDHVLALRRQGSDLIRQFSSDDIVVDLSGIVSSDSSALSLLIRWLDDAKKRGKAMRFVHMPDALYKVAEVCGVLSLLGLNN